MSPSSTWVTLPVQLWVLHLRAGLTDTPMETEQTDRTNAAVSHAVPCFRRRGPVGVRRPCIALPYWALPELPPCWDAVRSAFRPGGAEPEPSADADHEHQGAKAEKQPSRSGSEERTGRSAHVAQFGKPGVADAHGGHVLSATATCTS